MTSVESEHPRWQIIEGDCRDRLRELPAKSVHTCVTSPPYLGLRDYVHSGQIGLERNKLQYVLALNEVFREVRRVLRDDGTLWLNLGDAYDKGKSLMGLPWAVASRLKSDGWVLRSDIIWAKPNPMPESVTDRPTKAHEYLFLLSKGPRYFYDADAIREDNAESSIAREGIRRGGVKNIGGGDRNDGERLRDTVFEVNGRNKRSVWTVATQPYPGAHFATFPPKLIEPCILAGCAERGTVLDPFAGAGTTGVVALRNGRDFVGIELNAEYADLARPRLERYWRDEPRPVEAPQIDSLFTLGDAA